MYNLIQLIPRALRVGRRDQLDLYKDAIASGTLSVVNRSDPYQMKVAIASRTLKVVSDPSGTSLSPSRQPLLEFMIFFDPFSEEYHSYAGGAAVFLDPLNRTGIPEITGMKQAIAEISKIYDHKQLPVEVLAILLASELLGVAGEDQIVGMHARRYGYTPKRKD